MTNIVYFDLKFIIQAFKYGIHTYVYTLHLISTYYHKQYKQRLI